MVDNLFGTDGIRGLVNLEQVDDKTAISRLVEQREVHPAIMKLIGESLGRIINQHPQEKMIVVVGWDDRPANMKLAESLTIGLNLAEFEVVQIGLCATPTLHLATLSHNAEFGCMITASHNPVEDSGLKIFNRYGYKTTPKFEQTLSHTLITLAQEERELDQQDIEFLQQPAKRFELREWTIPEHRKWLENRATTLASSVNYQKLISSTKLNTPLLIDSSKGTASIWFAEWLSAWGIEAREVSAEAVAMNLNCGAGDFSPTQTWTFDEAQNSPHLLIQKLPKCGPGLIVAAALDGDGDRCLLIETTKTGYQVIDGDRIADTLVNSVTKAGQSWTLAATIESDLSLTTNLDRFQSIVHPLETAVGDRWLSFALSSQESSHVYFDSVDMPTVIGVEDSGHIVLAAPHPNSSNQWSLVGDGTMTLVAYLIAIHTCDETNLMKRGWKNRQSVKNVDRGKWDGKNQLSDDIEHLLKQTLTTHNSVVNWSRGTISGEPNLMAITCNYGGNMLSIGIRNSGTQAKISVSARLEYGGDSNGIQTAIDSVCQQLAKIMVIH
ncbi:MAG: hypothetical protein ISP82_03570 [Candidatus Poseidoniaceae archaeon]|nr:hypothetical protein [Candidatus Poseidoniaceae archaeon]MBL6895953.1 hypothetical protein [Candidatus Poseidoniaceae archaeon]